MPNPEPQRTPGWRTESLHLAQSGAILALNQLLQLVVPFVTTAMTGRLGVDALAAGSVIGSIGLLLFITALGVMQGLIPPLSMSLGAGDRTTAARTIRGGLVIAIACGLAATAIMLCMPWALAKGGLEPALVEIARKYVGALLPGYLPSFVLIALRSFLVGAHDLRWLNPIIVVSASFNVACNLLLASGWGRIDGMTAIGLTISMTHWLTLGLLAIAVWRSRRIPPGILDPRAGLALRDALKLGIPVGAIFFTEALLFTGSSVLMGRFGSVPLAAHGIVLLWLNVALMIPVGISQAAMARVASLLGQREFETMKQAVLISLVAATVASSAIGVLLILNSETLVRLTMMTRSNAAEEVVEVARDFFRFCAVTQVLSGLIIVMASILRGLRDDSAVLWLVILGYWGVGLGGAGLFAFVLGFGGRGIWMGITLAFLFAVVLMATRFRRAFHNSIGRTAT